MPFFACSATITTEIADNIRDTDRHSAARVFRARHGRNPDTVGRDAIIASCEACGAAIFEGEDCGRGEDSVVCRACYPADAKEEVGS